MKFLLFSLNKLVLCFAAEPEHATEVESIPIQPETPFTENEDAKPVHAMLPITQTHLPIYHSEQHYPVIVKTEDFPHVTGPIVISEEQPPLEPQTRSDDNLPVQPEQQSYVEQAEEEGPMQEEFSDRGVVDHDQEQRVLLSQEEAPNTSVYQADNIEELQTQDEQVQDEHIHGEEVQHEQIQDEQSQGVEIQVEQLQEVSDAPLRDHEQFTSKGNFSAEDSSTPWMQESVPVYEQPDEFYTPNEQVIPQSQAYSQEYQEDSYDNNEPWVMVDYPPAEEQDSYFPPDDRVSESQQVEQEMTSERYLPQEAEEEADYQYYDDEPRIDNDEADEPQPAEVCRVDEIWAIKPNLSLSFDSAVALIVKPLKNSSFLGELYQHQASLQTLLTAMETTSQT